jgi:hypothetical protein
MGIVPKPGSLRSWWLAILPGGTKVWFRSRVSRQPGTPKGRMDFELVHASPASVEPLALWLQRCLEGRLPSVRVGRLEVPIELKALHQTLEAAIGAA